MVSLTEFAGEDGLFAAEYEPVAYVVKRATSFRPAYDVQYNKKVQQIADKIESIMKIKPAIIDYEPILPGEEGKAPTWKGVCFLQYDPDFDDLCTEQSAVVRFWVEAKEVVTKLWFAMDDQLIDA